ncbi:hypothetical protein KW505_21530 [Vibrio fluvialis]|uniref:GIY-YIG domain-containing protein n=1 Tax=Vibrio fluvialis TaxID=676 RepID=A0AAX2LT73_VIBFL|nr:hypothetical protein [Vibrio fluvialis]EKO3379155.1 hypothetical protein [Vibrio fluvialis]MBY8139913.1 hypothetical protein [Vibrio fluvialis]MBY8182260.1 hypothetical protein [Vibrio fluvialis]MBY8229639.1 hypothetical protein [Vibrio fluvialis]MCE7633090.1 hypothetical protein [Vibrio fluvialis]
MAREVSGRGSPYHSLCFSRIVMIDNIDFSEWFSFHKFETHEQIGCQGTYIIGQFDVPPTGKPNELEKNIVYVGETTQKLKVRLRAFVKSAFERKAGHSGGWTFSDKFLQNTPVNEIPRNLYISIYCPSGNDSQKRALAKFAERKVILDYCLEYGEYPACNKN